jgi:DsbC/DsbD-like thiol-disulfide interchange protein
MPTVVHLNPPEGILIMNIQYPQGEELALPFMGNEKLNVYSGQFTVTAEVRIPKSAALGTLRIHGDVKYQACDNRQCFPPKTTPLQFDVKVVRPTVKKKATFTPASPHIH